MKTLEVMSLDTLYIEIARKNVKGVKEDRLMIPLSISYHRWRCFIIISSRVTSITFNTSPIECVLIFHFFTS